MKRKAICKAIIAIAVALAFVMPVAAVANVGTFGVTSNIEITGDIESMVESTTISDNTETTSDDEKPFIEPIEDPVIETLSIVNDANSIVSAGKIWYVGSGPGNDSTTIQGGINLANASGGDTVYVYSGTYNEKITINKQLDLIGESNENVIISGPGSGNVVTVTANDVNISTFAITKGAYGMYITGSTSNIINCNVYNNYGYSYGYGIYLSGSSGSNIINCEVYENHKTGYSGYGYGIYLLSSSGNEITNCDVHNNYGMKGYGIYLKSSSGNKITNCDIHHQEGIGWWSTSAVGIYLESSSNIDIIDCKLRDNRPPVTNSYGVQGASSSNNVNIKNCEIYNNGCFGIHLRESSSTTIENCNIHDNNKGVLPQGTGISLSNPHSKILNTTVSGSGYGISISSSVASHILIDNCTVRDNGGQAISTTLAASDNIIRNSEIYNNTDEGGSYSDGGIVIGSSSNTIENCDVHDNVGPGISIWYSESSGNIVKNCEIYNNTEDGIFLRSMSGTIANCNIYNNVEGIYSDCYKPYQTTNNIITHCNVHDNDNYGIYLEEVLNSDIISCNVYNNGYGIYLESSLNCELDVNTINDNAGNFGVDGTEVIHFVHDISPLNMINGKPIWYLVDMENVTIDYMLHMGFLGLISCTNVMVKNTDVIGVIVIDTTDATLLNVGSHGGVNGIYLWVSSNINMINCDVHDNNEQGIYVLDSSSVSITNCDVYNNANIGIYLEDSLDSTLSGNTLYDNVYNFDVSGETLDHYIHDIDSSNMVGGKLIYYLHEQGDLTLDETDNIGYLAMVSCWNITAENLDVNGVKIINTTDSTLSSINSHDTPINCVYLWMSPNCSITNCNVYNAYYGGAGIYANSCPSINIANCNAYDNGRGIYLVSSPNSVITNCTTDNTNTDYFQNRGIYLASSNNSVVTNCDIAYSRYGLGIYESSNCTGIGCTVYDVDFGIQVSSYSHNNIIMDCDVSRCKYQSVVVRGRRSTERNINNKIINCSMYDNTGATYTVYIRDADYTDIINCKIRNSPTYGIYLYRAQYGTITGCTIRDSGNRGIYIYSGSNDNKLYHNNLIDNNPNAYDGCTNTWDNGYSEPFNRITDGGNYWSNYNGVDLFKGPNQDIPGSDGIGDTPYVSGKINDNYPLMYQWDSIPPVITDVIATPERQNTTLPVNITCTVTDNWNLVNTVKVNISGPEGFTLETIMSEGSNYYYIDIYAAMGIYYYYIWANDTQGNIAISDTYTFAIIEFDEPISSVNPLPTWMNAVPFPVDATAYDDTGVDSVTLWYRYSIGGMWTAWTFYGTDEDEPWSWSFTGSDGYYEFYSIAVDDYGNVEDPPSAADRSTGIDTVKPITTIGLDGTMGENGWYTSNCVNVTLSATDELSGVGTTWYQVDSGVWTPYAGMFTVCGEGIHTVAYFSVDNAGNMEDIKTTEIKIDPTAPETTHILDGWIGSQGWYVSDVTVTLSASDATSGVAYTKYKLNEGEWTTYADPFIVTEDGEHTLYYYSVDIAGNTEETNEVEFKIEHDIIPPVTTHDFDGTSGDNDWFVSNVAVTLTATDNSAGVDYTMYKLDTGDWTSYTEMFVVTGDAVHTLLYYSVDNVGNEETVNEVELKIDQTVPTINLTWDGENSKLVANVSDNTSGVAKVDFYVNGDYVGNATEYPYEWVVPNPKQGDMGQAIVFDNAGLSAISEEIKAVSQGTPQGSSTTPVPRQILSWLFGLW